MGIPCIEGSISSHVSFFWCMFGNRNSNISANAIEEIKINKKQNTFNECESMYQLYTILLFVF
jgi:hypothetical protein